jgi:hypothetical protein
MDSIYEFVPNPNPESLIDCAIKCGKNKADSVNWALKTVDSSRGPLTQAVSKCNYYVVNFLLNASNKKYLDLADYNCAFLLALNNCDYKSIHLFIINASDKLSLLLHIIKIKNSDILKFTANHPIYQNEPKSNESILYIIQILSTSIIN